jgi:recombination protein RecR
MRYPTHLLRLIETFKKLPGVGARSAERFAFELLRWPSDALRSMGELISATSENLFYCAECGSLADSLLCGICASPNRDKTKLCIVGYWRDLFAIESTGEYLGSYHVLGALLSPMEGINPKDLPIDAIRERIGKQEIQEIVIALDATLEGDTTALYLKQELSSFCSKISRIAFGLPMGSSFDYVDGGTLARAFSARSTF